MGKKSRRNKAPRDRRGEARARVHEDRCYHLARRWDGKGVAPWCLFVFVKEGTWNDPSNIPSARARERLGECSHSEEKIKALMGEIKRDE